MSWRRTDKGPARKQNINVPKKAPRSYETHPMAGASRGISSTLKTIKSYTKTGQGMKNPNARMKTPQR